MIVSITFSFVNYCDIVYQNQLSSYRVITSNTGQKYNKTNGQKFSIPITPWIFIMTKSKECRMVFGWNFDKNKPLKLQYYFGMGEWMQRCAFRVECRELNEKGGGGSSKAVWFKPASIKVCINS